MHATHFDLVGDFHIKFDLPHADDGPPELMAASDADRRFIDAARFAVETARDVLRDRPDSPACHRLGFLAEELAETLRAVMDDDLPGIADGLADLRYVTDGAAHFYRIPLDDVALEVHRANMDKERGPTPGRGSALDVRKPAGWRPPDVAGVLRRRGWRG